MHAKSAALTDPTLLVYLLNESGEDRMKGTIRVKDKCPNCGESFEHVKKLGYVCRNCKTTPKKFYLDLNWQGKRIRLFCDKSGLALDSYQRALNLQATIQHEIDTFTFDSSKYVKAELSKYWASTLLDQFLEAKLKIVAPSYKNDYKRFIRIHKAFFSTTDVREIRKIDIINYMQSLEGNNLSGKTVKNIIDNFKTFLTWLRTDLEVLSSIPSFPAIEVQPYAFTWLGSEDQIKVLSLINDGDRDIIAFLMLHGCRPSEARALKVKDIDINRQVIIISSTFSGDVLRNRRKGRGAKPSIIPIHPEMKDFFIERCNNHPEAFVFLNPKTGNHYASRTFSRIWERARAKGNLSEKLRLYDATRHSVGSQLANQNVSPFIISKILGHSSIKMTERYMHENIDGLKSGFDKITLKDKVKEITTVTKVSPNGNH
ncbi:tyrosine-type recombinase/integrase [Candidatus Magnetominusculus xianensis]|uniref:Tyrosine recombinase XerC n=1 Tax=Candidatus Magnetominusculus xianensis TaxID=1748249 RepID=A0ABR5SI79_9BACT|nr:site-specific integrase [Candidatus Magnetominusculus xianensis]KWT92040.1 tyrosine recombinase XerC [Candidatus Magnetominusculus xianensis]MBF0404620.1 site-specific integrase [Nitrospirota bacterium]